MHMERLQRLRDHLVEVPDDQFCYSDTVDPRVLMAGPPYPCGAVGCVAGHACLLFALQGAAGQMRGAAAHLDLLPSERDFLFLEYCGKANRDDALRRLDHLLAGKTPGEYSWCHESWVI